MKLDALLPLLDDDALDRLSAKHLGVAAEPESRAEVCALLESELRSPRHLRETIYNLQPPAFRVMELLLDAPDHAVSVQGLRDRVLEDTDALSASVTSGVIANREPSSHVALYRRVFLEARRSDLEVDASEAALLAVLRRELKLLQIEHFLAEHHGEFRSFWGAEHAFLNAMNGLRSGGLVFALEGKLVLPRDLVPMVRQVLGLEMSTDARRRLVQRLTGAQCADALGDFGLKVSGSKEERVLRVIENYLPPSGVLAALGIGDLRDLCRDLELPVGGSKEELVTRIVAHFSVDADIAPLPPPPPEPAPEPRVLSEERFTVLFASLRQQDLSDILSSIDASRTSGTKEQLVQLLKDSRFSEATLLGKLNLKQLEVCLERSKLKPGGSKRERVERMIVAFKDTGSP